MKTTVQWLDEAKAKHQLSDYALAPKLGVGRGQISRYRNGADFLSDDAAFKLAELLEIDPAQIVASAHAERAKSTEAKAFWMQWAERLGSATAAAVVGVVLAGAPPSSQAAQRSAAESPVYIMLSKRRRNFWSGLLSHQAA